MPPLPAPEQPILIATAMRVELDPIIKRLGLRRAGNVFRGRAGHRQIIAAATGAGRVHVEASLPQLIRDHAPSRVIYGGFCAGIDATLATGDTAPLAFVRPAETRGEAYDLRSEVPKPIAPPRCPPEQTLLTMKQMVATPAEKAMLGPLAVSLDMESLHAARICQELQMPLSMIRIVCDHADDHAPAVTADWITRDGRTRIVRASAYVLTHPAQWGVFVRLAKASNRAGEALATAVAQKLRIER